MLLTENSLEKIRAIVIKNFEVDYRQNLMTKTFIFWVCPDFDVKKTSSLNFETNPFL